METRKRPRKAFNKVIKALSELYEMPYNEVSKIYVRQDRNIESTRMILNLKRNSL